MQVHHVVLFVHDAERSLRFYRDGVGCTVLVDREFDGDWPTLLGVASTRLRAIILGSPDDPHVGQVELVTLADPVPEGPPPAAPATGTVMLSFLVALEPVLARARRPRRHRRATHDARQRPRGRDRARSGRDHGRVDGPRRSRELVADREVLRPADEEGLHERGSPASSIERRRGISSW